MQCVLKNSDSDATTRCIFDCGAVDALAAALEVSFPPCLPIPSAPDQLAVCAGKGAARGLLPIKLPGVRPHIALAGMQARVGTRLRGIASCRPGQLASAGMCRVTLSACSSGTPAAALLQGWCTLRLHCPQPHRWVSQQTCVKLLQASSMYCLCCPPAAHLLIFQEHVHD